MFNNFKKGHTLLFGIEGYTSGAKHIINKFGNAKINDIQIYRIELSTGLKVALNVVSLGEFKENLKKIGYDKLYHTGILVDTDIGRFSLEKNDSITMKERPTLQGEHITISGRGLTLNQILKKTQAYMGNKYFVYDAVHNNCQSFILALLKSNNLNTATTEKFVKQNVDDLFNRKTRKIINTATETGGRLNSANLLESKKQGHLLNKSANTNNPPNQAQYEETPKADIPPPISFLKEKDDLEN